MVRLQLGVLLLSLTVVDLVVVVVAGTCTRGMLPKAVIIRQRLADYMHANVAVQHGFA